MAHARAWACSRSRSEACAWSACSAWCWDAAPGKQCKELQVAVAGRGRHKAWCGPGTQCSGTSRDDLATPSEALVITGADLRSSGIPKVVPLPLPRLQAAQGSESCSQDSQRSNESSGNRWKNGTLNSGMLVLACCASQEMQKVRDVPCPIARPQKANFRSPPSWSTTGPVHTHL